MITSLTNSTENKSLKQMEFNYNTYRALFIFPNGKRIGINVSAPDAASAVKWGECYEMEKSCRMLTIKSLL